MVSRLYSVSPWGNLTGAPICALEHVQVLRERFDQVCLILCQPGPMEQRAQAADIPVWLVPLFTGLRGKSIAAIWLQAWRVIPVRVRYVWRLYRKLKQEPGLLHLHSLAEHTPYSLIAGAWAGVPIAISIHEPWTGGGAQGVQSWLIRGLADHVVFSAQAVAEQYPRFLRRMSTTLPFPVQVRPLRATLPARPRPLVAFPARMGHRKGYDVFLRVCQRLQEEGVAFEAWMAGGGWGTERERLEAREFLAQHQLESVVVDLDQLPDLENVYAQMDVLLLTSRRDPQPRVIMEAMSYGIPVVATRVDGIPEMVADGVTGFLVEPEDVAGFAQAVETLLADADLRARMGAAGRERAVRLFAPGRYAEAITQIYAGLGHPAAAERKA